MKSTCNSPFLIDPEYDPTGSYTATIRSLLSGHIRNKIDKETATTNVYVFLSGKYDDHRDNDRIVGIAWGGNACRKLGKGRWKGYGT